MKNPREFPALPLSCGRVMTVLQQLKKWGEFVKFSHTVFALPFALAAMAIAARDNRGWPGWEKFLLILAAMVCARTCAMSFNRIVDRRFDALNPRTAGRHLPTGAISLTAAWSLCVLSGLGLVAAAYLLNPLCFYLSPVALFFICFYSLTKRFTHFTHVFLGVALALAPVGAWLAVKGSSVTPLEIVQMKLLALAVILWLVGFDIIYALQDYEFDRTHGLHSLVVAWGPKNALAAAFLSHLAMVAVLVIFGLLCRFRLAYLVGIGIITLCLFMEHLLARKRTLNWIQLAFFRLNALISVVFLVVVLAEVIFKGGFRFTGFK
ncbi:putative 4-hydroxybenzoate polyprenyltransferase [Fontisphaera persica]|uniref:UbiA-like polyprenyltransferase n=1 Tax=Fontisphaera persica TaxID=2974023 RepID=UPI0024C09F17|nr:UbiA-like polyprenyltransferase [Fontisphaera persica]WCJ57838.1 putative 4-hydroxybenzoate polyprenyltransferase [Fontisphaera persica]